MKFPWVEVGKGTVKRQSSGDARPGVLDLDVGGSQHLTPTHKTLPDLFLFPIGSGSLSSVTLRMAFQMFPASVRPSPIPHCPLPLPLSTADITLSPTFSPALLPSTCRHSFPSELAEGKSINGQLRGEAVQTLTLLPLLKEQNQKTTSRSFHPITYPSPPLLW